jgi:hypothetical protein
LERTRAVLSLYHRYQPRHLSVTESAECSRLIQGSGTMPDYRAYNRTAKSVSSGHFECEGPADSGRLECMVQHGRDRSMSRLGSIEIEGEIGSRISLDGVVVLAT